MKHHSQIPQQKKKIQKILFPPKPSSSARSCTNPPPQPIPPSNPKQTPTAPTFTADSSKPVVNKESAKGTSKDEKIDNCLREMFRFDEMGMNVLKRGMELVGESERLELDRRWKRLRVQESRVFIMRAELIEEQLDLIYKELQGLS